MKGLSKKPPLPKLLAKSKPELSPMEFQQRFFQKMGAGQEIRLLFGHIPNVGFFAKDGDGRFISLSPNMVRWCGISSEDEVIGSDDSFLHSLYAVEEIRRDDKLVIQTGIPIVNRVEMLFLSRPGFGWYCTTKLPIHDAAGKKIGVMGITRPYHDALGHLPQCVQIRPVIRYIETHKKEAICITALAKLASCSERQLNRHFHSIFGVSARDFVLACRIQAAMEDLRKSDLIANVAADCGFYDQSHFTRQFHHFTGETPKQYRARISSGS